MAYSRLGREYAIYRTGKSVRIPLALWHTGRADPGSEHFPGRYAHTHLRWAARYAPGSPDPGPTGQNSASSRVPIQNYRSATSRNNPEWECHTSTPARPGRYVRRYSAGASCRRSPRSHFRLYKSADENDWPI